MGIRLELRNSGPCLHLSCAVEFAEGVEHGRDVRDRNVGLDVVDRVEDEAAAPAEDLTAAEDLLAHGGRRSEHQGLLRVHAAAPEDEVGSEFGLKCCGVHPGGRALDRVEDIEPRFDDRGDKRLDRAAGVLERLPGRVFVDPGVDLLVIRRVEGTECIGRAKGGLLGAEIRSADEDGLDPVSDPGGDLLQIGQGDLGLLFEDRMDIGRPGQGRDVPFLDVADALGIFEERRRDEGDVAEGQSAEGGDDRPPGLGGGSCGLVEIIEVAVRDRTELFQVIGWVELGVVDWSLADDGVEKEPVFGQAGRGRREEVALGMDERVAVRVLGRLEMARDEDLEAVVQSPRRPGLVAEAEHRLRCEDALDVEAEDALQVVLDQAEHLIGLVDFDQALLQAVMMTEGVNDGDVHARDRRPAEIHRDPVGLLMVERPEDPFFTGHESP